MATTTTTNTYIETITLAKKQNIPGNNNNKLIPRNSSNNQINTYMATTTINTFIEEITTTSKHTWQQQQH